MGGLTKGKLSLTSYLLKSLRNGFRMFSQENLVPLMNRLCGALGTLMIRVDGVLVDVVRVT